MKQKIADSAGETKSVVMRLVGTALLWVGLAALAYVPTTHDTAMAAIVAVLGFASFATGLALFADALKRDIVARLK